MRLVLRLGDCLDRMAELPDASIEAICCDPPYGLEFMGREWDRLDTANYAGIQTGNDSPHARRFSVNFLGSPNPTCRKCGGLRSLMTEGSGGRKKCHCEHPDFPNYRTPAMQAQQDWHALWLAEALRVLSPGGFAKVFGGTRTYHRLGAAMGEVGFIDIGLEAWTYGSGFPKSLDAAKAIDKHLGVAPQVIAAGMSSDGVRRQPRETQPGGGDRRAAYVPSITQPASPQAQEWDGWGTALKPAWEPVLVGRKPG